MYIDFNNVSGDLQKLLRLRGISIKDIENETDEVNSEFSKRRDRLQFHEKLVRGFHRVLGQFKATVNETGEWCDKQTKEATKIDLKNKATAATEIMKIDVSLLSLDKGMRLFYMRGYVFVNIFVSVFMTVFLGHFHVMYDIQSESLR